MISFDQEIIPKTSLGGIKLNDNISGYLSEIYNDNFKIDVTEYEIRNKKQYGYSINDKTIFIVTLDNGQIISLQANENYKGKVFSKFQTGISIIKIKEISITQNIINGCLILDKDYGYCFILPPPYDEIADSILNIPDNIILNTIYVADIEWWVKPSFTPDYAK